jgi:hypothetical protein
MEIAVLLRNRHSSLVHSTSGLISFVVAYTSPQVVSTYYLNPVNGVVVFD